MLDRPTVFVIGAGTGHGINMPLGNELSQRIARYVDVRYSDDLTKSSGDDEIIRALRRVARESGTDCNLYFSAGRLITQGIKHTRSIDNFVNTHHQDGNIQLVAKLGIVRSILRAERDSHIFINERRYPAQFRAENFVCESWLSDFLYLLQTGHVATDLRRFFDNLTIINFNYDRCIKHYIYRTMQELYPNYQPGHHAELITGNLKVIHPYGSVGSLPWESKRGKATRFGEDLIEDNILELSKQILTYTERVEDDTLLSEMQTAIAEAHRIIFLGFHFHKQNMELLNCSDNRG